MVKVDTYIPTRIVFGAGRLKELATAKLPGKKALICVTEDGLMKKLGIQDKVEEYLKENHVDYVVYDKITPNPTRKGVMEATTLAKKENCDFTLGLGGGSSVDTAKAAAIMLKNDGDIWDYANTGSGGRKEVKGAAPIVTVSTTCGTGTETDPYAVITNENTGEKLDFAMDAIFPTISFIDPELMLTLPHKLTLYQGFDALFHVSECYISNEHSNRLLDVYSTEAVKTINKWLPEVAKDGNNLEARSWMAYAADILGGYTQSIINTTSHHIIAQTIGGLFPKVAHGLSLIFIAEAYYNKVKKLRPELLDELGEMMGVKKDPTCPGNGFVTALTRLMDETGVRRLAMSEYGITPDDFQKIADITVDSTKIDWEHYTITKEDIVDILKESYR
ncbi:MAG: iron-containing alcohol dehydrogenase [Acidaminococcus sp.]|jgi:alcohol dehydrogenase|nr:iron-containing alcohol dehydrogenase [Acidaminococcus sp.]MCI2099664.1 iron-containing alcohol dehydrogenase [Acidaminococcus sp.]MCI2113931.1 iron-containing alcohol dehydrogenase [Acidaminococcus sp.]MCI2115832.1 iron-containing alcohol dehydrogenase [Acidaminococcus sp.]